MTSLRISPLDRRHESTLARPSERLFSPRPTCRSASVWILALTAALLVVAVPPAAGQGIDTQVMRLASPDQQVREAAVAALTALGPVSLDAIFFNATVVLGPRFQKLAEAGEPVKGDPILERTLADIARALAAMGPAAVEPLARHAVADEMSLDADVSLRALEILGGRARRAVPILTAAFMSEKNLASWGAMVGLAMVDGPDYPVFMAALRSPKPGIRSLAIHGLGKTRSPAAVDAVLAAYRDPNADAVLTDAALAAMRDLGPLLVPKIPDLLADESAFSVPFEAMGAAAVPVLERLLLEGRRPTCERAGLALARAGDGALPVLARAQDHPSAAVRLAAISAIAEVDGNAVFVADGLLKAWSDRDPAVREAAVMRMSAGGAESGRIIPVLTAGLQEPLPAERLRAVMGFAKLGRRARSSAPVVLAVLEDRDAAVRSAAAQALGLIGADAGVAVPRLVPMSRDADAGVRQGAAFALGLMPASPEILSVLLAAVDDPEPRVATEALFGLWRYEASAAACTPALLRALRSRDRDVRLAAIEILSKWRTPVPDDVRSVVAALRAADADPEVKKAAEGLLRSQAPAASPSMPAPPPPPPMPPLAPMFRQPAPAR